MTEVATPLLAWIFFLTFLAFALGIFLTPIFTHFAYKYRWWRKPRSHTMTGEVSTVVSALQQADPHKRRFPTMAGLVILASVGLVTLAFNLNRAETWLPLFTLFLFGLLGFWDDLLNILGKGKGRGLSPSLQILGLTLFSAIGAYWFYSKLGWNVIHIPAWGDLNIGWLYIPLFIAVVVSTSKAVSITDGLDGLSGGLLSLAFTGFAVIAYFKDLTALSAFCATVVGAVLAYTWFNVYPARFLMGQTGSAALGATLGVVALLTNSVLVLPIIGILFVVEAGSSALQVLSKRLLGRRIFRAAPIHHHFQAVGWPESKVVARFWIIGAAAMAGGLVIGLLGAGHSTRLPGL
jgi:phospho-N-acetylmuramoyl-pentapeptide-transferase